MAHFYASINAPGRKSNPTARGHKTTGLSAHVRGWSAGVAVHAGHTPENGADTFLIYATHGSNGGGNQELIGTVSLVAGSLVFTPADARIGRVLAHK